MRNTSKLDELVLSINPQSIKAIRPVWQRSHYRAAINWLTKYKSSLESSNLQKVHGYLEAFHHLSVVQEWATASKILSLKLDTPTDEELHKQLHTWGYYQQQIAIYNRLIGKLNYKWDIICLSGLGNTFDLLGNHQKAINYYEQWQKKAKDNNDIKEEALAICSLGIDLREPLSGELVMKAFISAPDDIGSTSKIKRTNYRAVSNWLKKYQPPSNISNVETVRGVLEAFHHLCSLEDWNSASQILKVRLKPNRHNELCDQLLVWGYSTEVIDLYNQLLKKMDSRLDGICLAGIGRAYNLLGDFAHAIQHLESSLDIFQCIGDRRREGLVLEQLGISYRCLKSSKAVNYHQSSFLIAQEIGYQLGQATSLGELGITYTLFEEDNLAIDCLQQSLALTQNVNYKVERTIPLNGLGSFYLKQGKFDQAVRLGETQLTLSREIGYLNSIGNALCILGEADLQKNNYDSALNNIQEALIIFREIHTLVGEARALNNLAEIYYHLEQNDLATSLWKQASSISSRIYINLRN